MSDDQTLDLNRYIPALLTFTSNKLSHGASEKYRRLFGVGMSEWRVIAMLAFEPGVTASRLCQMIGIDKALASRVVQKLVAQELVSVESGPSSWRSPIHLTAAGKRMHARILRVVRERERILHSAFSKQEIETLLTLLHRLLAQADVVNAYEPSIKPAPVRAAGRSAKSSRRASAGEAND